MQNRPSVNLKDNTSGEDRRLLVTFVDRSINRGVSGNALDNYAVRGNYANSSWSVDQAEALARQHHLLYLTQWPVTELGVSCVVFDVPENEALEVIIEQIRHNHTVSSVQRMNSFKVLGDQSVVSPAERDPYLAMQTSYQALGINDLHPLSTGRGVRLAIIDTGVDLTHPDLLGQIKYNENLAAEPADHNLADIHGTAVAGIVAAKPDNGIGIAGIAPEADIYALRACWPDKPGALAAHCNSFTLALALNQAIRLNTRVINLSLSGPEDGLLRQLLEKAIAKGIIVIAALPGSEQVGGFPANIPGVLAVGVDQINTVEHITAPGEDILTTVPHQAYDYMTGSSFATPHVAGVVALLLQLHPEWQTVDIKRVLGNRLGHLAANLLK